VQLVPYLSFDGQCEEAFRFYQQCLGGHIDAMIPHEQTPAAGSVPPEWGKKILHAHLSARGAVLMGGDPPPGRYHKPTGFCVSLQIEEPAEAERIFRSLGEKGQIQMPMQETFFAERFGMLIDRFGIPWMVNCPKANAPAPPAGR
jgi:PhnB protein